MTCGLWIAVAVGATVAAIMFGVASERNYRRAEHYRAQRDDAITAASRRPYTVSRDMEVADDD